MSTRRERAAKRRRWVQDANGRNGLVPRCLNCGQAGPHFVPPSFGDPGFYACTRLAPLGEADPNCLGFCGHGKDPSACPSGCTLEEDEGGEGR